MKDKPCLDCKDRQLHCHSKCEKYQATKKDYNDVEFQYQHYKAEKRIKYFKAMR